MTERRHRYIKLVRLALVIVTAMVIVWFMPHEHTFTYDYAVGKPWKYQQIIAEYDFPIYKSQQQLEEERDSVIRNLKPFFNLNKETARLQVHNLRTDLSSAQSPLKGTTEARVLPRLLEEVYKEGVVSQNEYFRVADSVKAVSIISGATAQVRPIEKILSQRMAYEHIRKAADSLGLKKELVAQSNLYNYIIPNLVYDRQRSLAKRTEALGNILPSRGMVQSGQKIIDRGEIITDHTMKVLQSLQKETDKRSSSLHDMMFLIAGQLLCVIVLLGVFLAYLILYRPDYANSYRCLNLLFSLILIFTVAASLVQSPNELNIYVVPFAMVPIFVRVFMDSRTALATILVIVSICSLSLHSPYEFILLEFIAGMTAIYSLKELTSRSQLFRSVLLITAVTTLIKLGYDLSQGFILSTLDPSWYVRIAISGVLLLFAYPLMLLFEKMFGFISSVTLVELSNVNTPLLRRLSKEAQGTFNHSMQVANLAAEVAQKIGASVQLVRTAALYHDIGKLNNPAFFTENQTGFNPHDKLTEEQRAQIIIRHVPDGLEMADKYGLPSVIKECIATHHGRSKTKYFYIQYINKHPGEPVNEELFTYPGPNPQTKEQAILMMADAVEAASRSLKQVDADNLRHLVDNIIDQQVKDGYFTECPITFRDITTAKEVLWNSLKTIYHARISYPTLIQPQTNAAASNTAEQSANAGTQGANTAEENANAVGESANAVAHNTTAAWQSANATTHGANIISKTANSASANGNREPDTD